MRHALLIAAAALASLAGPAQGARLSLSFGGGGQIQRYRCTLKDGRIHAVQAPTRGRAYRACQAWAAEVDGALATVLPVSDRDPSGAASPAHPRP
ncbi:MAG: hypothetical protein KC613_10570 [Myxococcales bacterium]|nr:hypothetical protein [Myxococcales bacterium]MCB9523921.1 hypothetical protein [Myxococcales bacterium]